MKMHRPAPCMRRQRGVATVLVTLVLLLAVGLISLYTSRSAVIEQRISANEVRAKQALAAANAGIDQALAYMATGGIYQNDVTTTPALEVDVLVSIPGVALPSAVPLPDDTVRAYQVVFRNAAGLLPDCPATSAGTLAAEPPIVPPAPPLARIMAVSCGWSDDNTSVQRVMQELAPTPSLAGTVSTPMVTKGGVDVTGNVSVFNYFNDLTVWSGEPVSSGSAPGKTYIRTAGETGNHRTIGQGNVVPPHYQASTLKDGNTQVIGHDVVGGDSNLRDLNTGQFFQRFMGDTIDRYRARPGNVVIAASDIGTVAGMKGKVIWVDVPPGDSVTLPSVGEQTNPVIMVINGNAQISANTKINGLVFVIGDVDAAGTGDIFGSLINTGKFSGAGGPAIVYDPVVLDIATKLGRPSKVAGTWRDW